MCVENTHQSIQGYGHRVNSLFPNASGKVSIPYLPLFCKSVRLFLMNQSHRTAGLRDGRELKRSDSLVPRPGAGRVSQTRWLRQSR